MLDYHLHPPFQGLGDEARAHITESCSAGAHRLRRATGGRQEILVHAYSRRGSWRDATTARWSGGGGPDDSTCATAARHTAWHSVAGDHPRWPGKRGWQPWRVDPTARYLASRLLWTVRAGWAAAGAEAQRNHQAPCPPRARGVSKATRQS